MALSQQLHRDMSAWGTHICLGTLDKRIEIMKKHIVELLEQLLKCIAVGMTEQEYFEWISDCFKENGIHLTKQMKKLFRELRNDFPSAVLKGYTWGEYEKHRKDGYQQLVLFEEEVPF